MRKYNGDVKCDWCENFENGCCENASEALRLEGWPAMTIKPSPEADASYCPDFRPHPDYLEMLREAESYSNEVNAVRRFKGMQVA